MALEARIIPLYQMCIKYEFYSPKNSQKRSNLTPNRSNCLDGCRLVRTIPNSAFSSFFPAVWRYMRHNGCQCRCCPYTNRFKADDTTVMLIGNVEECGINPTLFFWSFHVVRFCERRVKFKLASPLYSDHPYNVAGGSCRCRPYSPSYEDLTV